MCQARIAYWSCTSTHMRARRVTYCDDAIATDLWDPSACPHYTCVYSDHAEKTLCPFCSKRDGLAGLVHQISGCSGQGMKEWLRSEEGDGQGRLSPPAPPVIRPLSRGGEASSISSCTLELPACPIGKHDLGDTGDGGVVCSICGFVAQAPSPWERGTEHTCNRLSSIHETDGDEDGVTEVAETQGFRREHSLREEKANDGLRSRGSSGTATHQAHESRAAVDSAPTSTSTQAAWGDLEWAVGHSLPEW